MVLPRLIEKIFGRIEFQKLFNYLYGFSLAGMNYGCHDLNKTGEMYLLRKLNQYFSKSTNNERIIIFDVGANIGNYSKLIKRIIENDIKLYIFEPSKETFKKLKQAFKNYDENILLYNFGLGNKNETRNLYSDKECSGLASIYKRKLDYTNINMNKSEIIELRELDVFCIENSIKKIHFLKLDVEGNEYAVLKGAKNLLNNNIIDFIQFEFGGCNIDSRTFFKDFFYLLKPRYKIFRIVKNGLILIDKYSEKIEIFNTMNYIAVNRRVLKDFL